MQDIAVVSGGGSGGCTLPGVGEAVSRVLGDAGYHVIVADRDEARAERTVEAIRRNGKRATPCVCDVASDEGCERLASSLGEMATGVQVLVNCVGEFGPRGNPLEVRSEEWNAVFNANVTGILRLVRVVGPLMVRAGRGRIVNVGSVAGSIGVGHDLAYSVSKAAVAAMTRSLAVELGPSGICVNIVVPGYVMTPMVTRQGMDATLRQKRASLSPLGTEGTAWDVAQAVGFLVSEGGRWITGAELRVDGGFLAWSGRG